MEMKNYSNVWSLLLTRFSAHYLTQGNRRTDRFVQFARNLSSENILRANLSKQKRFLRSPVPGTSLSSTPFALICMILVLFPPFAPFHPPSSPRQMVYWKVRPRCTVHLQGILYNGSAYTTLFLFRFFFFLSPMHPLSISFFRRICLFRVSLSLAWSVQCRLVALISYRLEVNFCEPSGSKLKHMTTMCVGMQMWGMFFGRVKWKIVCEVWEFGFPSFIVSRVAFRWRFDRLIYRSILEHSQFCNLTFWGNLWYFSK